MFTEADYDDLSEDPYMDGFQEWAFKTRIVTKEQHDDDLIDWDDLLDEYRDEYNEYLESQRGECWTDYVTRKDLM